MSIRPGDRLTFVFLGSFLHVAVIFATQAVTVSTDATFYLTLIIFMHKPAAMVNVAPAGPTVDARHSLLS